MSYWYLATPYTNAPEGREAAAEEAARQAALLIGNGFSIFSPVAHFHPISQHVGDPGNSLFWVRQNRPFMAVAKGLIMCKLPGWQGSEGMLAEYGWFSSMGKPLVIMQPGVVPEALFGNVSAEVAKFKWVE